MTITDERGAAVPARVYLTGPEGAPVLPEGAIGYDKVRSDAQQEQHFVPAALGACNLVGLANNHFWRSGFYAGPWGAWPDHMLREYPKTCSRFAMAGFEMYYALLNAGFVLSPSAGSISGVHPVPPGWSRVYVHVDGKLTPKRWFDGVESGHSFVTTGPMLLLTVDGHAPSEEISGGAFPRRVRAEVTMLSTAPVTSAEVVVNGDVHPFPLKRRELQYLLGRTEALIKEVETGLQQDSGEPTTIVTPNAGVKEETLRLFREARAIYAEKHRTASPAAADAPPR